MKKPIHGAALAASLLFMFTVTACGKAGDGKTAGQQLDSAIAKTGQAAAEAKAKTESSMASAGSAIKGATNQAEASGASMAEKAGDRMDDALITSSISTGFAKDPDLSAIKIDVDTKAGVVTLSGTAPSEAARERAATIAKGVKGVSSVDNKLVIKAG